MDEYYFFVLVFEDLYMVMSLVQAAASAEPMGAVLLERRVVRRVA